MTLSELCRLHKLDLPEPNEWGFIDILNPDANTERALMQLSDYRIRLNYVTEPVQPYHLVRLERKKGI